jgi:hypothetical protein
MRRSAQVTFDPGEEQVEAMMEQGVSFSAVEDAIDAAQLSGRHKAALWLLAWSLRDQAQQRRDARLLLAEVSGEGYRHDDDRYAVRKREEA